jgi:hypothetical protein
MSGTIFKAPELEALWQLHFSNANSAHNTRAECIANLQGPDDGNYLELTADLKCGFSVLNP